MIRIAAGVRLPREVALWAMCEAVKDAFEKHGSEAIFTSGSDGKHSTGSEHYVGHALDWRTRHLPLETAKAIAADVKDRLGPDFDILLESAPPHLHTEWDPK